MIGLYKKIRNIKRKKQFCASVTADTKSLVLMPGAWCQTDVPKNNIIIGTHCTLGCLLMVFCGGKLTLGNNVYVAPGSIIQSKESVAIGDNTMISNNVIISDNNNHPTEPHMRLKMSMCEDYLHDELWSWKYASSKPVVIEDNVWIGRDVRIMKGVTIGRGSIVALGAIVTQDVPPYSVVAGNPARVVKTLNPLEEDR